MTKIKLIVGGVASYIPLVRRYFDEGGGGTSSARYCYSVWMRHLILANDNLHLAGCPKVIAELGPGKSLGTGLAALISGCDQYYAFDVVDYAGLETNLRIFNELVGLYKNREDIPGPAEFPEIRPALSDYKFPHDILNGAHMARVLAEPRLDRIKRSLYGLPDDRSVLTYKAPWDDVRVIQKQTVDMVFSQAVLEHVNDLAGVYHAIKLWLKLTGFVSNQIDFRCHGTADEWNGHWTISDFVWKLSRRNGLYLLNREPHSKHIDILRQEGFEVISDIVERGESRLKRDSLAPRFQTLSTDDLTTCGAFVQARLTH